MAKNRHLRRRAAAIARRQKARRRLKILAKSPTGAIAFACPLSIHAQSATIGERRRFEMLAYTGEPLNLDNFPLPVVIDIATVDYSNQHVPALHQHEQSVTAAVGQIDRIQPTQIDGKPAITAGGYFTPTDLPNDSATAVMKKHDAGQRFQASVGGNGQYKQLAAGQKAHLNGREYTGPLIIATGFRFKEISFVMCGADEFTSVTAKSSAVQVKGQAMTFEQWALGFLTIDEFAALDESAKSALKKAYDASGVGVSAEETPAEEQEEEPVAAEDGEEEMDEQEEPPPAAAAARKPRIRAAGRTIDIAAEAARQAEYVHAITAKCKAFGDPEIEVSENGVNRRVSLLAHALRNRWDVNKTELEAMKHERGIVPAGIIRGHDKSCTLQALQGAMILRAGGKLDHPAYKTRQGYAMLHKIAPWLLQDINASDRNRYMDAAHRYGHYSMLQICEEACRLNRIDTGGMDRDDVIRAAFSGGGNLSNVFTTNVNAILLASYVEFSGDTTVGWVREQDVNDFKTNERPRVQIPDGLKKLSRGNEAEATSYTDKVESYKIARYARQFEIDEQDIIDDNFSIFQDTPAMFGIAAARLRPDLVYGAIILANPTLSATSVALFSDSNSPDNLFASSALSHSTLSTALANMRLVRENSINLNLQATHLLIPPTLEDTAIELTMSQNIIAAGTAGSVTIRGERNSLSQRGLQIVAEPRLENGVVNPDDESSQSGSSSTWYLVCADAHTIEVGYLKGTGRAPSVRSTVLDKGRWGMNWDVKMDIGVKALDHKGFNKSTA